MAKIKGAVVVNTERCKGCNLCSSLPVGCTGVAPTRSKQVRVSLCYMAKNPDACIGCASCGLVVRHLTIYKVKYKKSYIKIWQKI